MATVFERVRKVTGEQLDATEDEVVSTSSFASDLGADSLDLVELIMALEEEFSTPDHKISIPDEDTEKIVTVQDAVDYIKDLGVSDYQAPPPPAEKSGLPRVSLPKVNLPRPGFSKPQTDRPGTNQPPTGNPPRRDNRPRHGRHRGHNPRPNNPPPQPPPGDGHKGQGK